MTLWRSTFRGLAAAACLVSCLSAAVAQDIDGLYDAQGKTAAGKGYTGDVKLLTFGKTGGIVWKLNDGSAYRGLSIRSGDVLGAAYATDTSYFGVVVYEVRGGILEGVWSDVTNAKTTGREILEGPAGLNGDYKITTGEKLDGLTNYTGHVVIKPNGKTYLLAWLQPQPVAVGIGVLLGDRLVVAFGDKRVPGVVGYKVDGRTLEGIWSSGASKEIGTETLTRKP